MNTARLKEKARALEVKEQWREALELYTRMVEESAPDGLDISLWNRIGDLHLRVGQADRAIGAYESAVGAYLEAGLYNNAIALCNKILRTEPGRTETYLRLGQISASQGFLADARASFLHYAEQVRRAGGVDEAFAALKEFAALSPDDVEIRLQLAEHLRSRERTDEALEQLHFALGSLRAAGRLELEPEVREQILALDPDADLTDLADLAAPPPVAGGAMDDDGGGAEATADFVLLPTFELGASVSAAPAPDAPPAADLGLIEIVPTAHAAESAPGDSGLLEISHVEGLEPTHAAEPATPRAEETEEREEEAGLGEPLPFLGSAMEILDPARITLSEPGSAAAAADEDAEDAEDAEPLPLIPAAGWGEVNLDIAPAEPAESAPAEAPDEAHRRPGASRGAPPPSPAPPVPAASEEYIDLAALILGAEDAEPTTRFVVADEEPTGDEDRDFADMLSRFRQKVTENIASDDSASHYDLGLAFKDMGLLDEAIAQFQVALRGGANPLATLEVLGECFVEKSQYALASRVLARAVQLPTAAESELIGVFYLLARAEAVLGNAAQAAEYYERVLSLDIRFRDAQARLAALGDARRPASL